MSKSTPAGEVNMEGRDRVVKPTRRTVVIPGALILFNANASFEAVKTGGRLPAHALKK